MGSATLAGTAAAQAEAQNMTKYKTLMRTHIFVPLAFQTIGAWGPQCILFLIELGRRLMLSSGDVRESLFLRQRLSIAIQRGNAIACLGTLPVVSPEYN